MKRTTTGFLPRSLGAYFVLPVLLSAGSIAAQPGLRVEARLLSSISTYSAKSGDEIRALVTTPLCLDRMEIPDGLVVSGTIRKVRRVGLGLVHETASFDPEFRYIEMPDGRMFPLEARLESIDSARERIDSKGVVHGIRATAALSNRAGERLAFLAMGHPLALAPLFVVETAIFHFPDPEIKYRRGTEFYLDVRLPESWGPVAGCPAGPSNATEEEMAALKQTVAGLPYWSYSKRQRQPMDLVNLLFIGSQDAVLRAFDAAGWTGSQANSVRSGFGAIRALAERNPDEDAPMRTLLLDGETPALSLQKSLNTFEKRHHLRIWKRDGEWLGQNVWASAATQDIGTTFSIRPFGFTHEIQNHVDEERDKVVSDLRYTGCVASVTYVPRPQPVRASGQEYRRGITTDAQVAVVAFNNCEQPRLDLAAGAPDARPSRFVRGFRRFTLTVRNHFIRDNWFWRGYEGVHMAYDTVRHWGAHYGDERRAREHDMRLMAQRQSPAAPVEDSRPVSLTMKTGHEISAPGGRDRR